MRRMLLTTCPLAERGSIRAPMAMSQLSSPENASRATARLRETFLAGWCPDDSPRPHSPPPQAGEFMTNAYDLLIRGGTIVDGSGGTPFVADLAVSDGRIVAIGTLEGGAKEVVEAQGLVVTPGFVDVHTHYDGQAIWSKRLSPSSSHGVTTAITGNCGVGFAPCRNEDHETLVRVMEGVEDIPGVVMAEGLDWSWETFPDYLNALEARA